MSALSASIAVIFWGTTCFAAKPGDLRGQAHDNPLAVQLFLAISITGVALIGPMLLRFVWFLHVREKEVGGGSAEADETLCGLMARGALCNLCKIPCCAVRPQTAATIAIAAYFFACFFGMLRSNLFFGFAEVPNYCVTIYAFSYFFAGASKYCGLTFLYMRAIVSFQQSSLRLKLRWNICVGVVLVIVFLSFILLLALIIMASATLPIYNHPGKFLCSSRANNILRWWGRVCFLYSFFVELFFTFLFVYRINMVDSMSHEANAREPSTSTTRKQSDAKQKEPVSHFKKLAVKLAVLSFVATISSIMVLLIGAARPALAILSLVLDPCISSFALYMMFHDPIGEKMYDCLCLPCDACCLKFYPLTSTWFVSIHEHMEILSETITKMMSTSSRTGPDYLEDLRNENKSVASTSVETATSVSVQETQTEQTASI